MSVLADSVKVQQQKEYQMDNNYESHPCSVCGDTIVSPRTNEIHPECGAFRLIANILK
jgi:hypothetical protein